jgi:hypothetical protein
MSSPQAVTTLHYLQCCSLPFLSLTLLPFVSPRAVLWIWISFDVDPNSTYHSDTDPVSDFLFDADLTFHPDADPDSDLKPSFQNPNKGSCP